MIRAVIELSRYFVMLLFAAAVAVSFAGMAWKRKNILAFGCFIVIASILQVVTTMFLKDIGLVLKVYPLITHVPIVLFIVVYLKRTPLIALTSQFLAFLCYQVPRWFGSFTGEVFNIAARSTIGVSEGVSVNSGTVAEVISINHSGVLNTVSMNHLGLIAGAFLTFHLLRKYAVQPAQRLMNRSVRSCLLFGALPLIYYVFDYTVVIYTGLMYSGNRAVIQFMPSFVAAFYFVFALFFYTQMQKQAHIEKERDMLDVQFRLAQTEFDSLRQIQQNAAAYRHDMRHHFALLQGLASRGHMDGIKEYLRTAQSDMDAITPVRFCENETVNLILSAFAAKARQLEIQLTIDAKLPDSLPFSDTELCSLLSNALENAIHACEDIPDSSKRAIKLWVYSKNAKLCIDIRNTYQRFLIFQGGLPVSNSQGHGFGTKSMVHIVEKHGGVFRFSVEDGWFIFQATA